MQAFKPLLMSLVMVRHSPAQAPLCTSVCLNPCLDPALPEKEDGKTKESKPPTTSLLHCPPHLPAPRFLGFLPVLRPREIKALSELWSGAETLSLHSVDAPEGTQAALSILLSLQTPGTPGTHTPEWTHPRRALPTCYPELCLPPRLPHSPSGGMGGAGVKWVPGLSGIKQISKLGPSEQGLPEPTTPTRPFPHSLVQTLGKRAGALTFLCPSSCMVRA